MSTPPAMPESPWKWQGTMLDTLPYAEIGDRLRVRRRTGREPRAGVPCRLGAAQRAQTAGLAGRVRRRAAVSDRPERAVRRLLRQRRNRLPPGARLAAAGKGAGPVH